VPTSVTNERPIGSGVDALKKKRKLATMEIVNAARGEAPKPNRHAEGKNRQIASEEENASASMRGGDITEGEDVEVEEEESAKPRRGPKANPKAKGKGKEVVGVASNAKPKRKTNPKPKATPKEKREANPALDRGLAHAVVALQKYPGDGHEAVIHHRFFEIIQEITSTNEGAVALIRSVAAAIDMRMNPPIPVPFGKDGGTRVAESATFIKKAQTTWQETFEDIINGTGFNFLLTRLPGFPNEFLVAGIEEGVEMPKFEDFASECIPDEIVVMAVRI
jgi:hypothetical protein